MEHRPPQPLKGPLALQVTCYLPIPKSYSKKKAAAALAGTMRPVKKPDIDNLVKQLMDVMRGTFYEDDCQVCHQVASKWYGDPARWVVSLSTIESDVPKSAHP
jgi:Holliday junction resolvase RusA-like endonuclease